MNIKRLNLDRSLFGPPAAQKEAKKGRVSKIYLSEFPSSLWFILPRNLTLPIPPRQYLPTPTRRCAPIQRPRRGGVYCHPYQAAKQDSKLATRAVEDVPRDGPFDPVIKRAENSLHLDTREHSYRTRMFVLSAPLTSRMEWLGFGTPRVIYDDLRPKT